jgi:hypothetical protein
MRRCRLTSREPRSVGSEVRASAGAADCYPRSRSSTSDDKARPPQSGAYYREETATGPRWVQTDGYYVSAALLVLRFDAVSGGTDENPTGELVGYLRVNRGGRRLTPSEVSGGYNLFHSFYGAVEGDIYFELPSPNPNEANISITFRWFAKSRNELEFWAYSSKRGNDPYRGNVARGTLTRATYSTESSPRHPFEA